MKTIGRFLRTCCEFLSFGLLLYSYVNAQQVDQSSKFIDNENATGYWISNAASTVNQYYLSKVQKILDTLNVKSSDSSLSDKDRPTTSQSYGYGFLSIFVISSFSLAGALVFPLTKKPFYKYFNAFFTSLAVGALFANSIFELVPQIIISGFEIVGKKNNETQQNSTKPSEDEKPIVSLYMWQLLILVLTAYFFYVIEMMLNVYINYRNTMNQDRFYLQHNEDEFDGVSTKDVIPYPIKPRSGTILSATFPNITMNADEKQTGTTGWIIIVGDGIHNIADGLAIGAAFAENILVGIAQSIAIACQELPSELGEYMILIESGFTFRQALLFNFVSACTAFVGFFIGVSISENDAARVWIFSFTAGTFIYIALVDLWPKLMPEAEKFDWIRFGCVTGGYLFGIFVMFGLGILTEEVVPKVE